jgi:hypothetical protein
LFQKFFQSGIRTSCLGVFATLSLPGCFGIVERSDLCLSTAPCGIVDEPRVADSLTTPVYSASNRFVISGQCVNGSRVRISEPGLVAAEMIVPPGSFSVPCANSSFSFEVEKAPGDYVFTIQQMDQFGNHSEPITVSWTYDATPPTAPVVSTPASNPYFSNSSALVVSGSCEIGGTVALSGAEATQTTPCVAGTFAFTIHHYVEGTYDFTVLQTDAAGNSSSSGSIQWVRDASAPTPGGSGALSFSENTQNSVKISWSAASDSLTGPSALEYQVVRSSTSNLGSVANALANGTVEVSWTAALAETTIASLTSGMTYYFTVLVRDQLGNTSVYSQASVTTDAAPSSPPPVAGNSGILAFSGVTSGAIEVTWTEASSASFTASQLEYKLVSSLSSNLGTAAQAAANGAVVMDWTSGSSISWSSGTATVSVSDLVFGTTYYFNVLVRDPDGNLVAYTANSQATSAGPSVPTVSSPSTLPYYSDASSLTISGSCTTGNQVFLSGDVSASDVTTPAGTLSLTCAAGNYSFVVEKTSDGTYAFSLNEKDAGNLLSASSSVVWVRDTVEPAPPGVLDPPMTPYYSGDSTLTLRVACEAGANVVLSGSSNQTATCPNTGSTSFSVSGSPDISYSYTVTQTDLAGNPSTSSTVDWTYDSTMVATPTITSPSETPNYSNTGSITISGACSTATPTRTVVLSGDVSESDVTAPAGSLTQSCPASGTYSFTIAKAEDGTYDLGVMQYYTTTAGDTFSSAQRPLRWVKDVIEPDAPLLATPYYSPYASSGDLIIKGECEPGATITVEKSGVPVDEVDCVNLNFAFVIQESSDSSAGSPYVYTITQKDRALNESAPTTISWIKDSTLPSTPTITMPLSNPYRSNGSTLTLAGACTTGLLVTLGGESPRAMSSLPPRA